MSYVIFEHYESKPKTEVFSVINKQNDLLVGFIKWFGQWRQYCLFPEEEMVFNRKCLLEINEFIDELMIKRRKSGSK